MVHAFIISVFGRQRQVGSLSWKPAWWPTEFQNSQGYAEKTLSRNTKPLVYLKTCGNTHCFCLNRWICSLLSQPGLWNGKKPKDGSIYSMCKCKVHMVVKSAQGQFCMCVLPGASLSLKWKTTSDLLELGLWMAVSHHVGARNLSPGPLEESKALNL